MLDKLQIFFKHLKNKHFRSTRQSGIVSIRIAFQLLQSVLHDMF